MRNFCRCRDVFGLAGNLFVIGDDHAAAAGGDDLVAIEADGAEQTETARVLALVVATQRFRGILDQRDAKLGADLGDLINPARVTEGVHGHAGSKPATCRLVAGDPVLHLSIGSQEVAECIRAHAQRALVHVHENRMGSDVGDRVAGGNEGQCLGNDLITPFDASDDHRDMKSSSAVNRCNTIFDAAVRCDALLEFRDAGADRRDEIGVDALSKVLFFISAK